MGSKEVAKDSKQKQDKQSESDRKRNGQDVLDERPTELQRKSSERCNDRPLQRFENKRSGSPRQVRWSPPRRRSRSPRFYRSPRRMSRSPIRNSRPLRRVSRSPERFNRSPRRRFSRSPRRCSRSPRRRINRSPKLSFSLRKRSLSPFRRSPLDDGRRHNISEIYFRSRSPSVEVLDDSCKKIMTMKAKVVETGLVPPGMEMDFDLMTMCQTSPPSKKSSNTVEINKEKRINQSSKRSRSPTGSANYPTRIKYSPPTKMNSPEPKNYRNFLEEIEDTFASKEATLQQINLIETSHQSVDEKNAPYSTNVREKNVQATSGQLGSLRPNPVNIASMLQHATEVVSTISTSPAKPEKSCLGAVSQSKDRTRTTPKLLGDAKKTAGDNVQLNLSLTDKQKSIQNKINVISQCQNAIKLLSRDRRDGRFKIKEPSEKREKIMDLKGICPLRKVHIVRFQYTSKSGAAKSADTSILVDKLLTKVSNEPIVDVATSCEIIDLCESPGNALQEKHYSPLVELPILSKSVEVQEKTEPKELMSKVQATAIKEIVLKNAVSIAIQTEESQCDECQKRKNILRDNMYTQTNETLCFDVGCQINLNDICPKSPKAILKTHSITHFTPAQLLQQRNQGTVSEKSDLSPSTVELENSRKQRLSNPFSQDSEKHPYDDRLYTSSNFGSKRPGASAFFDIDLFGNRSYECNRYENTASSESKLFSRDRPQVSRPLLGKNLPFSNFDPKLNFDASFGRWAKKY